MFQTSEIMKITADNVDELLLINASLIHIILLLDRADIDEAHLVNLKTLINCVKDAIENIEGQKNIENVTEPLNLL